MPGIITTSATSDPATPIAEIGEPQIVTVSPLRSPSMQSFSRAGSRRPSLTPVGPGLPPVPRSPLPGEELNSTVTGVLASYPLAANKSPGGASHGPNCPSLGYPSPNNPFSISGGSTASLMDLNSYNASSASMSTGGYSSRVTGLRISDMPAPDEHLTAGSGMAAKLLRTPENEWVPEQWGYERGAFDPDMTSSDEEGVEEQGLSMRSRKRLIVDGSKSAWSPSYLLATQCKGDGMGSQS